MKAFTAILAFILAAIIAFCAIFWFGGELDARAVCVIGEATKYPDHFKSACTVLDEGTAVQIFSADLPDNADGWRMADINITLTNRGLFDAEWLNITVTGVTGDVAVYSLDGQGSDVPAKSTGTVDLKILTRAPKDAVRTVTIQYYVFGISRSITVSA